MTIQVLISALGRGGMQRLEAGSHPMVDGVSYLVIWQRPEGEIPQSLQRPDFEIVRSSSIGLSRSRNEALTLAKGDVLVISDDDVDYEPADFEKIRRAYETYPKADAISFQYRSPNHAKQYPEKPFPFEHIPFGYHISSIELTLRRESVSKAGLSFDERFGLGSKEFICGEEELFVNSFVKKGLRGVYVPQSIAGHERDSAGTRLNGTPKFLATKGAVLAVIHPGTWPLRLVAQGWRKRGLRDMLRYAFYGTGGVLRLLFTKIKKKNF